MIWIRPPRKFPSENTPDPTPGSRSDILILIKTFYLAIVFTYFDLYSTYSLQAHVKGSQGHQHGRHQKEDAEPQGIIVPIGQVPAVITQ